MNHEAEALATFVQGAIQGWCSSNLSQIVKLQAIEQDVDEENNYEHHFTLVTESGIRIIIAVEAEIPVESVL